MNTGIGALREFRRNAVGFGASEPARPRVPALFTMCSDAWRASWLVSSCAPAGILQVPDVDQPALAAIDRVAAMGAKALVVCGHAACSLARARGEGGPARFVEGVRRLYESEPIGARFRSGELALHALWFDEDEGDVFLHEPRAGRLVLLGDEDLERWLASLGRLAS